MAIETPIPSALGRLRRFARMLVGHQRDADDLVREMLTLAAPQSIDFLRRPATNNLMTDGFKALVRLFRRSPYFSDGGATGQSPLRELAQSELDLLTADERLVFSLGEIEGYSTRQIASLTAMHERIVDAMADSLLQRVFAQPRIALYVEPDRIIREMVGEYLVARHIEVESFSRASDGLTAAQIHNYDLLIAEPVKSEGSSDLKDLVEYAHFSYIPAIWTTASPWVMEGTDEPESRLLTKPFEPRVLLDVAQEALYLQPHRWAPPDETFVWAAPPEDGADVPEEALAPAAAPIDAEVIDGQLRVAPGETPEAVVPFTALDALRQQLRDEALYLADDVRAGNGSRQVQHKLDAIAAMLGQPLTDDMVIGLTVGIDGYARLLPTIQDEFLPLPAAVLANLVYDIQAFTNQFPVCRQFRAEAEATRPITADEEAALQSVVTVLLAQPDELVAPAVKNEFGTLQAARAAQVGSVLGDVGWRRSTSNALKALARHVRTFSGEVLKDARGKAVKGMSALIVALPMAYGLKLLSVSFPVEFAAVTLILTQSRERIEKALGKGDDEGDG